jgi:hypothetical protein
MRPESARAGAWKRLFRQRPALWYGGAGVLLTVLVLLQFLSLHVRERQLDRREQALQRISDDLHGLVQSTEQLASRIERDLHQQQQTMTTMQASLQQTNTPADLPPLPLDLPLEPSPSR